MGIIRILLALTVVIAHSNSIFGISLVGGRIAVQAFFIISGFYMSLILNEKYIAQNDRYSLFITNRFLRLYPLYWFTLIITMLYSLAVYYITNGQSSGRLESFQKYANSFDIFSIVYLTFTNALIFFQDIALFLGINPQTGSLFFTSDYQATSPRLHTFLLIPQAWSVSLELMFYLIAPFILRKSVKIITGVICICLALRILFYYYGLNYDPWNYRFFPLELVYFFIGNISYRLYRAIRHVQFTRPVLFAVNLFIISFTIVYRQLPFPYLEYLYFSAFTVALPFVFLHTKNSKFDVFIGDLSYPIYINHILVLLVMKDFGVNSIYLGLYATLASITLAVVWNESMGKRIEKLRQDRVTAKTKNKFTELDSAILS